MITLRRQRGVALFTAIFLLVVLSALAASLASISGQQHLSTAQTLDQTRAYYAARARLDREIAALLEGGSCPGLPGENPNDIGGFRTVLDSCSTITVNEGGTDYNIHDIKVRAFRGDAPSGSLVQRSIRIQATAGL